MLKLWQKYKKDIIVGICIILLIILGIVVASVLVLCTTIINMRELWPQPM